MSQRSNSRNEIIPNDPRYYRMQGHGNANADIQGNAPCTGARELYGRFCDQRLAPTNPAIFSGSFQPRACLRSVAAPNPAAVMRGVGKMCTIQTSRRPPIARQTQISKTAPMNPAIK